MNNNSINNNFNTNSLINQTNSNNNIQNNQPQINNNYNSNNLVATNPPPKKNITTKIIIIITILLGIIILIYQFTSAKDINTIKQETIQKNVNNAMLESTLSIATSASYTLQTSKSEYDFKINNTLFDRIEKDYIFAKENVTYYISPLLATELFSNKDNYIFKDVSTTKTMDASIIKYNASNNLFTVCLVISKTNKIYSKEYTTKEVTSFEDIKIPKGTMYACSNRTKSWQ